MNLVVLIEIDTQIRLSTAPRLHVPRALFIYLSLYMLRRIYEISNIVTDCVKSAKPF
jgi:hypothetical protein